MRTPRPKRRAKAATIRCKSGVNQEPGWAAPSRVGGSESETPPPPRPAPDGPPPTFSGSDDVDAPDGMFTASSSHGDSIFRSSLLSLSLIPGCI